MRVIVFITILLFAPSAFAEPHITLASNGNGDDYSLPVKTVLIMGGLSIIPFFLIACTSFLRTVIVLSIIRHAVGLMQTPSNQVVIAITLFITFFIMQPVFTKANDEALQPYLNDEITFKQALDTAEEPFRKFMTAQLREDAVNTFVKISKIDRSNLTKDNLPLSILLPSFIVSELHTAFEIGFYIFIPFLLIDLLVASALMSLGMMMVSPPIISLPIKILLLNQVGGWELVIRSIASTFG